MRAIYAHAGTITELSDITDFSCPKVSTMCKNLEKMEWIKSFAMPNHTKIISLSEKGKHGLILLRLLYTNDFAKKALYSLMEHD